MTTLLVASGKGGVGTSIVAALSALAAGERGERVLLVDATESGGSQHLLFGVRPTHSLWMLADASVNAGDVLTLLEWNITLVAGGTAGGATPPTNDDDRRTALTKVAQLFFEYDCVIIDAGSRLDTISAVTRLVDTTMLLVTSADRLALAANYALVKSVSAYKPSAAIAVIANRHGESVAQEACEFLTGACAHFLKREVDIVGAIPDDPCLQAAVGAGMTVRDALDGSPAAETMRGVLTRVIPSRAREPRAPAMSHPIPSFTRRWS